MRSPAEPRWLESQSESLHQTQCDSVRDFMERLGYTGYWLDPTTPRFVADFDLSINQVAADRPRWGEPKLDRYINNFVWLPDFGVAQQLGWPTATGELG